MILRARIRTGLGLLYVASHLAATGCGSVNLGFLKGDGGSEIKQVSAEAKAAEDGESLILRADGFTADKTAPSTAFPAEVNEKLNHAREAFRKQEYDKAESLFASIADKERNPPLAIQEAMYYHAEAMRLQGYFPKAADTYSGLLNKFPSTSYREQCLQHMYEIAYRWLDDTRQQMAESKEREQGKRWFVTPRFISTEKSKPFLDREGRAIEILEQVRLHDVSGPLADKALFLCGVVKMYNENYRDADHYFEQIYKRHPESPLTPKALELGIQCKHLSTGGSAYDGRRAAEARKMVDAALRNYPQLSANKDMREYLERQLGSINFQQAEKEFERAEFYRRTGHPGAAYFYYELVRRRYPGTSYAKLAEERWGSLRGEVEREQGNAELAPKPPQAQQAAPPKPQAQQAAPPKPLPADIQR